MSSKKLSMIVVALLLSVPFYAPAVHAKEFKVNCSSVDDCMSKGDTLTKKRKLSMALEAYRNAIKFDVENKDSWRKFEKVVVRISEEGGC